MGSATRAGGRLAAGALQLGIPLVIETAHLPDADQFAAWRHAMAAAIDIRLRDDDRVGFPARQTVWNLGSMAFAVAEMPGGGRVRSWHHVKGNPLDHWCLVLVIPPSGRPALFLRSLARSFEASADSDDTVLSLYLPRDLFPTGAAALDRLHEGVPDTALTALLADHLQALRQRLPGIAPTDFASLAEATRQLVAACLLPGSLSVEAADEAIRLSVVDRARRVVQQNLGRAEFGPLQLGRALGMSRSRLYRQFEPLGGVTHYIRRQRLLAAHAALSDEDDQRAIAEVAESVGFPDASSFSRAFRSEFGYRPSDARTAIALGAAAPVLRRPALAGKDGGKSGSLMDILASLSA